MEYWSGGDLGQALAEEPLLTFPNPSHDRADRRGAAASLVSGRLPGMTQSAVLPYTPVLLRIDRTAQWLWVTSRGNRLITRLSSADVVLQE